MFKDFHYFTETLEHRSTRYGISSVMKANFVKLSKYGGMLIRVSTLNLRRGLHSPGLIAIRFSLMESHVEWVAILYRCFSSMKATTTSMTPSLGDRSILRSKLY